MFGRVAHQHNMQHTSTPNTAVDARLIWGVGCCREPYLLRSCALSVSSLAVGYVCMTAATNIWLLLPSVVLRSLGSATLWIYSTLLLQFRVPNEIQGEPESRWQCNRNTYLEHRRTAAAHEALCIGSPCAGLGSVQLMRRLQRASSKGHLSTTLHTEVCRYKSRWAAAAGRVFALEMAFYVSTEMVSLLLGGVLFDRLHLTTRGVAAVMACVGVCCAVSRF